MNQVPIKYLNVGTVEEKKEKNSVDNPDLLWNL